MLLLQAKKESPLTNVRGEIVFHGTTLIYPARAIPDISCHPVTGMNRPAPRGLLQSGVPSPLRRGLSLSPLAEGRCDTADFVIAFVDLKFIIDAFRHLSRGNLPHFLQVLPLFPSACHHKRGQAAAAWPASCAFSKCLRSGISHTAGRRWGSALPPCWPADSRTGCRCPR